MTGCDCVPVRATARSNFSSFNGAANRATRSSGRNGVSHGTAIINSCLHSDNPLCIPASGPAKPGMRSAMTRYPNDEYFSLLRLALMKTSSTCGAMHCNTQAMRGRPSSNVKPLSTLPMRRPSPPASMTAVTGDEAGLWAGVSECGGDTVYRVAYELECRWPNLVQIG